jgi:predicted TIM-barrel enzyme
MTKDGNYILSKFHGCKGVKMGNSKIERFPSTGKRKNYSINF